MKALVCQEYGPPEALVVVEMASEPTPSGHLKIRVRAAGVNFPDVLIIKGEYQFKPTPPFSPGAEVSGDVLEVGDGVSGFAVGDRVIAMTGWNGFREEVVVAAERCLQMPAKMDYDTGAALSMTYGTSYHALVQRGRLKSGETLLVLGATGGVGTAAVEIGKLLGARVIAAGGSDDKLAAIQAQYGVDHVVNYTTSPLKDQIKQLTSGAGADVIYDAVGGDLFDQSLRSINWDGRLLVVGFASGRIPEAKANLVLLKGCSIVGVFWGAFTAREPETNKQNFAQLFRWFDEGKLKPVISKRYPLEKGGEALRAIVNREIVGKAVITIP
jgi:NADPH2:quinone reductase